MINKLLKVIYCLVLVVITFFVAGFFTIGVWAIYGRSIAWWALAGVTVIIVALCCAGKDK